jgi:hypothetical protein
MYYKLQFSNSAAGESTDGKRYVAHTFLIHGLAGDALAQFLRDNPKSRPDSATGLPMIRTFNNARHRGEAYAYRSSSIDKMTGLNRWRVISSGEIEKRLFTEYPMLVPHQAGQDRLSRMAIQELREIVAGKVVASAPVADAPVAAAQPPADAPAETDLVDQDPSDEGSAPF